MNNIMMKRVLQKTIKFVVRLQNKERPNISSDVISWQYDVWWYLMLFVIIWCHLLLSNALWWHQMPWTVMIYMVLESGQKSDCLSHFWTKPLEKYRVACSQRTHNFNCVQAPLLYVLCVWTPLCTISIWKGSSVKKTSKLF